MFKSDVLNIDRSHSERENRRCPGIKPGPRFIPCLSAGLTFSHSKTRPSALDSERPGTGSIEDLFKKRQRWDDTRSAYACADGVSVKVGDDTS